VILVLDNYDSFTFNLVQLVRSLGGEVRVVRNDECSAEALLALGASHVIVSPGPGRPEGAGVSLALIARTTVPVLGVCLGHQAIAVAFGGSVGRAPNPVHGRATRLVHDGTGVFAGVPSDATAARYHSLVVYGDTLPACLEATAHTDDGLLMALRHRDRPIVGVQFHPESVLTPWGPTLVRNFLEGA